MDTTSEYVKMCQEAKEIQALWPLEDGDFYIPKPSSLQGAVLAFCALCNIKDSFGNVFIGEQNKGDYIWLPRQDQLQELVKERGLQSLTWNIYQFTESVSGGGFTIEGSMEQLWLAFVMEEKFGKIWDGEAWTPKR